MEAILSWSQYVTEYKDVDDEVNQYFDSGSMSNNHPTLEI